MIHRKRLTGTRRIGKLELRTVRGRYSDGTPDGRLVLWIRTPRGPDGSRRVAYVSTPYPEGPLPGLYASIYPGSALYGISNPVAIAKAIRRALTLTPET